MNSESEREGILQVSVLDIIRLPGQNLLNGPIQFNKLHDGLFHRRHVT